MKRTIRMIVLAAMLLLAASSAFSQEGIEPSWWELTREELRVKLGRPATVSLNYDVYMMDFYYKRDAVYVYYDGDEMVGLSIMTPGFMFKQVAQGLYNAFGEWDYGFPENRYGYVWYREDKTFDVSVYGGITRLSIEKVVKP